MSFSMTVSGTVFDGTGRATLKMVNKDWTPLGYAPYPGTMNLNVGPAQRQKFATMPALRIPSPRCDDPLDVRSKYIPVSIYREDQDRPAIEGHASFNRGERTIETFAPCRLREALDVDNGDRVSITYRPPKIPRIIHQVWVGDSMPDHLRAYCERWSEVHPDWEYKLWTEADLYWLENKEIFDQWPQLAPRNRGQFQANIARYEILHRYGGVYLDVDMDPVRPLDSLLDTVEAGAFATWQRDPGHPKGALASNAAMGCVPNHGVLLALITGIPRNIRRNKGLRCTYTTGVRYLTKELQRQTLMGEIDLLPSPTFFPYLPDKLKRVDPSTYEAPPDAYAVHHWHNQRSGGHVGRTA